MQHCDPEDLALVALGEAPIDTDVAAHIAACAQCRGELESLTSIVSVGRSIKLDDQPIEPPSQVWESVQAEISRDASEADAAKRNDAGFVDLQEQRERRKNRRWVPIAVAAASCLVPGGVVGGLVVGGASIGTSKEDVPVTVASGTLEPVPGDLIRRRRAPRGWSGQMASMCSKWMPRACGILMGSTRSG